MNTKTTNILIVSIDYILNGLVRKGNFFKKIIYCCLFGLLVILLTGCAEVNTLSPLDKKTPAEKCAVLIIPTNAKVKRIDGVKRGFIRRSWKVGYWRSMFGSKATTLSVPNGEHTFISEYSNPIEGWSAKKLECTKTMEAGKMYLLSVTIDEKVECGVVTPAINIATSFVRDNLIDLIPFIGFLPRPNPKGVIYQINEIDQAAFDQYLLKKSYWKRPWGIILLGLLVGGLWIFIIQTLRWLFNIIFMGKFTNHHIVAAFIFSICLGIIGIILINYNSSGTLSLYLLSTLFVGIGVSIWDFGGKYNKYGLNKLKGKDVFEGVIGKTDPIELMFLESKEIHKNDDYGISYFNKAIDVAPYNAVYRNNRGAAYSKKGNYDCAIADFTDAVRLNPKNDSFKKNLANTQAQIANLHNEEKNN